MKKESISLRETEEADKDEERKKEEHLEEHFQRRRGVNFGRIAFGLFFICLGVYFLAKNTGFLPNEFEIEIDIWKLWPLLIVFAGLSMLSATSKISALIGSLITFVVIFAVGYLILSNAEVIEKYASPIKVTPIYIEKLASTKGANLNIETSGTSVTVKEGVGPLAKGSFTSNLSKISINSAPKDNWQGIDIKTKSNLSSKNFPTKYVNDLSLALNKNTLFDITLKSNAAKADLNLSSLQMRKIELLADSSNIKTTFQNVPKEIAMKIDVRTSNVTIVVPKTAGVKIISASELSLNNFEGLSDVTEPESEKNIYQTKDYNLKSSRIFIDLTSVFSSLAIEWF